MTLISTVMRRTFVRAMITGGILWCLYAPAFTIRSIGYGNTNFRTDALDSYVWAVAAFLIGVLFLTAAWRWQRWRHIARIATAAAMTFSVARMVNAAIEVAYAFVQDDTSAAHLGPLLVTIPAWGLITITGYLLSGMAAAMTAMLADEQAR